MNFPQHVQVYDCNKNTFSPALLEHSGTGFCVRPCSHGQTDLYLTPGWIDAHAHVYAGGGGIGVDCDAIAGVRQGVHMVIDAGTTGANSIGELLRDVPGRKTIVKAYVHINRLGIRHGAIEGAELELMDADAAVRAARAFPGRVVGIKVRVERPVTLDAGLEPLRRAKAAARRVGLPLAVHIGAPPPDVNAVLDELGSGDIICHPFHAKGGEPWDAGGLPSPGLTRALARCARLDLAHGRAAFSYEVFRRALGRGLPPFIISSDIHSGSWPMPVSSLAGVMSKAHALGLSLADTVRGVTVASAALAGETHWCDGWLERGNRATLFRYADNTAGAVLYDSTGACIVPQKLIVPCGIFIDEYQYIQLKR